jgi:shikimate kinase
VVHGTTNTNLAPIVLIGLMGAGKTSVGRSLALRLDLSFIDADDEIIKAAGCSIPEIFDIYGEKAFRDVEERVIERLIGEGRIVLATGGGAYMANHTRSYIKTHAISVWLRADLKTLVERTSKRRGRPLLDAGSPHKILKSLIDIRYPIYQDANIIVDTDREDIDATVDKVVAGLLDAKHNFESKTS